MFPSGPVITLSLSATRGWIATGRVLPAFAAILLSVIAVLTPQTAQACGWWGDGESENDDEAIVVDKHGVSEIETRQITGSPEFLTRKGNQLRRLGASGYAGAIRLYRRAALAGHAPAQNNLAAMYEKGLGVAPDLAEAARWYRSAAEQGEPHAQHSLGEMLLTGRGIAQNRDEGIQWIEKPPIRDMLRPVRPLGISIRWIGM